MGLKVSSFKGVRLGDYRYVCILTGEYDFLTPIGEEVERQAEPFARAMGGSGLLVQSFEATSHETFTQLLEKTWPDWVRQRMENNFLPFMVIVTEDFASFDPQKDRWAIVWFADYEDQPKDLFKALGVLARKIRGGDDILAYLRGLSRRRQLKNAIRYVEVKPEIWGISVDAKAIFEDVAGLNAD